MSEEFDKEAEREKLREKFADDARKREHTQRMSDLLLKGATMTNRHCEQCGDPIFSHDGREFCPTCNATADGAAGVDEADGADNASEVDGADMSADDATAGRAATTRADAVDTGSEAVDAPDVAGESPPGSDSNPAASPRSSGVAGSPADGAASHPEPAARPSDRSRNRSPGSDDAPITTADSAGEDVAAARESLTRTLTRFARAAEATDDPRRAREHLRAAREAAEALAALE